MHRKMVIFLLLTRSILYELTNVIHPQIHNFKSRSIHDDGLIDQTEL